LPHKARKQLFQLVRTVVNGDDDGVTAGVQF
jgi:hypothetical protein